MTGAGVKEKYKLKEGSTLEIQGGLSKLDEGCQQRRMLWIKEWRKETFWTELEASRKRGIKLNWGDCKEDIYRMFSDGTYEILWALMMEEISGKFPDGVPSTDIG